MKMPKVYLFTEHYGFTLRDKIDRYYNGKYKWVFNAHEADVIFVESCHKDSAHGFSLKYPKKEIRLISLDHVCGFVPDKY